MCEKENRIGLYLNKDDDDEFLKGNTIKGIYAGVFTVHKLPKEIYETTAKKLNDGVKNGYSHSKKLSFKFDEIDKGMIADLNENIYMFSAAKTFQQTLEMSEKLVDENGTIIPFKDFEEQAGEIFDQYNKNWLKAEYDTAISASRSASKWVDIQKNKSDFPFLKYIAVMDAHTCEICAPLDGITLPVDDPFWNENMTPQHFFCECTVETLDEQDADEEGVSQSDEVEEAVSKSQETKDPLFNFNPGKDKIIFQDTGKYKHPYFEVSKQYKKLAENNFGLEIPNNN